MVARKSAIRKVVELQWYEETPASATFRRQGVFPFDEK
jgi:hypothetical protein